MKKKLIAPIILCLFLAFFTGCGKNSTSDPAASDTSAPDRSTAVLDFNRYYNHSLSVFLEDFGLTEEDLTRSAPYNYDSNDLLPFLNTTATYQLLCDEEDQIAMINLWFETENDPSSDFDEICYLRDYFNGLDNALFLNDLEEYSSKEPHLNTEKSLEEFEAALTEYAEAPLEERSYFAFSRKGYWNLENDIQIQMEYRQSPEAERSMIYVTIRNSQTAHAVQPDGTLIVPEDASLFDLPASDIPPAEEPAGDAVKDSASYPFQWSLPGEALEQSPGFSMEEGGRISVSFSVTPTDKTVKFGIVNSQGERTFLTGTDVLDSIFTVPAADTYHIFIENQDSDPVEIEGTYRIL